MPKGEWELNEVSARYTVGNTGRCYCAYWDGGWAVFTADGELDGIVTLPDGNEADFGQAIERICVLARANGDMEDV
jgi:hypothetical protein